MRLANYVVLMSIVILGGCASFRDGASPPLASWPPPGPQGKKTIAIKVSAREVAGNQPKNLDADMMKSWRSEVLRAYETSNLFSEIKDSGTYDADIFAEVKITDKVEANKTLSMLTWLTVSLVPSKSQECFSSTTSYRDKNGVILNVITKSECLTTWRQLFLLPVGIVNSPPSVRNDVIFDLNRNSILDATAKGIFN